MNNRECPCRGCENRTAVCHCRGEDGAWRCRRWGTYMAECDNQGGNLKAAIDLSEYHHDAKERCMRIKKRGR